MTKVDDVASGTNAEQYRVRLCFKQWLGMRSHPKLVDSITVQTGMFAGIRVQFLA